MRFAITTTLRRATRELGIATIEVAREGQFAYRRVSLDRPIPTGFETIPSVPQFTDAVSFDGKLYLCGPTGLFAYDRTGTLIAQYRSGRELPAAPLVRMAVGVGAASPGPLLWIATHGAGLLAYDGHSFQQILPDSSAARVLTAVLPLATGRVLLGTEKTGVLVWDGKSLAQFHPALAQLHVTALAGSESDLWAGTIDQGVWHWHAGQLDRFSDTEGLLDARVLSLALKPDAAYVGTALGVVEFRDGRISRTLASGFFANALLGARQPTGSRNAGRRSD